MAILGQKVCVVLPAYNAARTLEKTYCEIPQDSVDSVLLVDDGSRDETLEVVRQLGLKHFVHPVNRGYGANQKTCYRQALQEGADIVVMLHPDYQYSPRLIPALVWMVASGHYDIALGSRLLGGTARSGGMPLYKYVSNRFLTSLENLVTGANLSEYHTGYRAFSRRVLESLPLEENGDGFVFDNQILAQALHFGFRVGEMSCPTRYFPEASSVGFGSGVRYGLGVLRTTAQFALQKAGLAHFAIFDESGRRLLLKDGIEEERAQALELGAES
ncbi:MAG TPA: glycosyltransferase family 2 protein [Acidobacteriota bacterium]|nr:glycosyltransferase family 2 protein [Acidobacteriota bacterium]